MFCSECGQKASGKFCSNCGQRLTATAPGPLGDVPVIRLADLPAKADEPLVAAVVDPVAPLPADWDHELNYETLLSVPRVRETIARHAAQAKKTLSGEEFLKICDKVMPLGVPMEKLAGVIQPLYARFGIATGKQRVTYVGAPVGRVMVRTLCSLARNGQNLKLVKQADDGCCFEAVLPSDVFALEGDLLVGIRRHETMTEVSAATKIPGQFFDWGKSNRCLDRLLADLFQDAA